MLSLNSKYKKVLIFSGSFFLLGNAVLFLLIPLLIKTKLPELIQQTTGQSATLANVQIKPWPFSIQLQNFSLHDKQQLPVVAFENVYLEVNILESIHDWALVINQIAIDKPSLQFSKRKDGSLTLDQLYSQHPEQNQKDTPQTLFPFSIKKISLNEGELVYQDTLSTHITTINPIKVEVVNFSSYLTDPASLQLLLTIDKQTQVTLTGHFGINPMHSEGQLNISQFDLKNIPSLPALTGLAEIDLHYQAEYSNEQLKLDINNATLGLHNLHYSPNSELALNLADINIETEVNLNVKKEEWLLDGHKTKIIVQQLETQQPVSFKAASLSATADYQLNFNEKKLNLMVKKGLFDAKNLQLFTPTQQPFLKIPALAIHGIDCNLDHHTININSVSINDVDVILHRLADGSVNYQQIITHTVQTEPTTTSKTNNDNNVQPSLWRVSVDKAVLSNADVEFTDDTLSTPTTTNIKPINLTTSHYNSQPNNLMPLEFNLGINGNGSIKLTGNVGMTPPSAKLDVAVQGIELEKFHDYFDQFINLDLIDGSLNINGHLNYANSDKLDLVFEGDSNITDFLTRDQRIHKDFVKWLKLSLDGISINTSANRYTANELNITRPYARVTIRKDKTVNFSNLLVNDNSAKTVKPTTQASKQTPVYFKLGNLKITDASTNFSDLSLILPFSAYIQDMEGGASGLSSEENTTIKLALKGNAYDLSSVNIAGQIRPFLGDYDIDVNFNGLPMPLVSPYMVQFAGYKVEKGKMTLDLNYKVNDKKLTVQNKILIDQFELGEKIDNPNALPIPLKLGIALLKDANGKIKFNFPISGSLDDPQFNISDIVADALENAITKIITSPFALLTSLEGSEEDLSTIGFSAGSDELTVQQKNKLTALAKSLLERPALTLSIKGTSYQKQDWPAISDDALFDQLKLRRSEEINKDAVVKIRPEYVKLSDDEYRRLLADMFIEKFPNLADKSLLGIPRLKNAANGDFYEIAKQKLMEVINPELDRLRELAVYRARAIAKYIVQNGKVTQERVFILDTVVDQEKDDKAINSLLSLKAD